MNRRSYHNARIGVQGGNKRLKTQTRFNQLPYITFRLRFVFFSMGILKYSTPTQKKREKTKTSASLYGGSPCGMEFLIAV